MTQLTISVPTTADDSREEIPLAELVEQLTHKLRNQLSVIITAASQLDENIRDKSDPDDLSLLTAVLTAADRLEHILQRFVQYGCPDPPRPIPININDLCLAEVSRNQIIASGAKGGVRFITELDHQLPPVFGDANHLRLILSDLIDNAVESIDIKGTISLKTSCQENAVVLTVEDTGRGIPAGAEETIFKPFLSLHSGLPGMGLAIARRLTRDNQGTIDIVSRRQGGVMVKLKFPIMEKM
ncbi:MAG: hypothetical protein GY841_09635 [FCB group bacterium]|nr:hypothetical protein [FCB group bacterium]